MARKLESKAAPVPYHFVKFGEDFLLEGVGLDAAMVEVIKASLPVDARAKVLGWRNVSVLPDAKGGNDRMMFVGEVAHA